MNLDAWEGRFREFLLASPEGDAAHGLLHIERVVENAKRLAALEGATLEIVLPAAWLHDSVSVPKDSPLRSQASRLAATHARSWLAGAGYPEIYLTHIEHAIAAHSFSAKITPETIEAKVVQDADRLDALGAIGLARCLGLGAVLGTPLYHAEDPFCRRRVADDSVSSVDHFFTKLLHLEETMQTASGAAEAASRAAFLKAFLVQLERELPRRSNPVEANAM